MAVAVGEAVAGAAKALELSEAMAEERLHALVEESARVCKEWRSAAVEAERDTYRFEKGLNYFDQ